VKTESIKHPPDTTAAKQTSNLRKAHVTRDSNSSTTWAASVQRAI